MGTFRLTKSFIEYTVSSATSESGGFVKENLNKRQFPKRAWRSTGTTQQEIVIDLLSARNNPEVLVEVFNGQQIRFIGSDDGVVFSGFDTGVITVEKDEKQGVYRYGGTLTGFNHRYVKVVVPSHSPADGAAYFSLGTLAFMASTSLMVRNPRQGLAYVENSRDGFLINESDTGGADIFNLTVLRPLSLQLSIRQPFSGGSSALIWDTFRNKDDIVYINFGLGKSWQAYLVRRTGRIREQRDTYSHLTFDTFEVALVV